MASHGSDTNKVNLLKSFPPFFFQCLSACLSFCLSYNIGHLLMSFSSFFFLFCMSGCQKKVIYLVKCVFSFFSVSVPFCLSNKGHLLMSFPSFCFFFYLSVKQRSFINDFSFVSVCPVGGGGGGGVEGRRVFLGGGGYFHIRAVRICAV